MNEFQFVIEEEKPDHHFRYEIPNCIDDIGLDPYTYRIYGRLKRIAGDYGNCWQSIPHLAESTNMSEKKVRESLEKLEKGENKLNLPLIKKTMRKKADGSPDTSIFTILNIWAMNGSMYKKKKEVEGGGSPQEPGVVPIGNQGGSRGEPKEQPSKKTPLEEQQQPVVVSSKEEEKKKDILKLYPLASHTVKTIMAFELDRIKAALKSYDQWVDKHGPPDNINAWILSAVKEGYKPNRTKKQKKEEENSQEQAIIRENFEKAKKIEREWKDEMPRHYEFSVHSNYIGVSKGQGFAYSIYLKDANCIQLLENHIKKYCKKEEKEMAYA